MPTITSSVAEMIMKIAQQFGQQTERAAFTQNIGDLVSVSCFRRSNFLESPSGRILTSMLIDRRAGK